MRFTCFFLPPKKTVYGFYHVFTWKTSRFQMRIFDCWKYFSSWSIFFSTQLFFFNQPPKNRFSSKNQNFDPSTHPYHPLNSQGDFIKIHKKSCFCNFWRKFAEFFWFEDLKTCGFAQNRFLEHSPKMWIFPEIFRSIFFLKICF